MKATLYLDLISPYAYFYWHARKRLDPRFELEAKLVVFGAILKHWEHKGPAELPTKRIHTYQQCVWLAQTEGFEFSLPARHPFNTLKAMRLLLALQERGDITDFASALDRSFHWVWGLGHDPELEFEAFARLFDVGLTEANELCAQASIKAVLAQSTSEALAAGVWGVPTLLCANETAQSQLFWGFDSIQWANQYVNNQAFFQTQNYLKARDVEQGIRR
jgi:2-hydroxychromene-2-carboxylate isomerase